MIPFLIKGFHAFSLFSFLILSYVMLLSLGKEHALLAAGLSLGAGSLMGLGILLWRRGATLMARRYLSTFQCLTVTGKWSYVPPGGDEPAATRFPYAAAIAVGTLATLWWSGTLSEFIYLARSFLLWI